MSRFEQNCMAPRTMCRLGLFVHIFSLDGALTGRGPGVCSSFSLLGSSILSRRRHGHGVMTRQPWVRDGQRVVRPRSLASYSEN